MRKTYEKIFCDCCGCEIVEGSENLFTRDYYNNNGMKSIYLPYIVELRHPNKKVEYTTKTIELKDICNGCYSKIYSFTEKLIPNLNDVIEVDQ